MERLNGGLADTGARLLEADGERAWVAGLIVREKIRQKGDGYRPTSCMLAQYVEVGRWEVYLVGGRFRLLGILNAANGETPAVTNPPNAVPGWRRGRDSNPGSACADS